MGKVVDLTGDSDVSNDERVKKRKRKKDLEEIRRNALAVKRNLRSRAVKANKPKTSFMKTLNEFASKRKELEEATQTQGLLLKKSSRSEDHTIPKPLETKGFFRGGVKGKQLTIPLRASQERFRNAVLQGDALQLLQSGNLHRSKNYNSIPEVNNEKPINNLNLRMQMKANRILKGSSESSFNEDDSEHAEEMQKVSPILGRAKHTKREGNVKPNVTSKILKNTFGQKSPVSKHITKEEKCRRRLFPSESESSVDQNNKSSNICKYDDLGALRFSPRKSTPENVIFIAERINDDKKIKTNVNNNKINPFDQKLVNYYIRTSAVINEKELKGMCFNKEWKNSSIEDSMETSKVALKNIYKKAYKDYIRRLKSEKSEGSCHSDQTNLSNNSRIMLEPDSAVRRDLKNNIQCQINTVRSASSTNFSDTESYHYPEVNTAENNKIKRKRVPSSKGDTSEAEVPSSTRVNVDPKSTGVHLKINSIQAERQELVARYLNDINTNSEYEKERGNFKDYGNEMKGFERHSFENEKVFNNGKESSYLIHKNIKHVPAILRKNRSSIDCVIKEKIVLNTEKISGPSETLSKASSQSFDLTSSFKSERTPSCENLLTSQLVEAPKCKYVHMNAKYNQPSRINVPFVQAKRFQINNSPDRHLLPASSFVHSKNLDLSPIIQKLDVPDNVYEFRTSQLSQENSKSSQENNCMNRMVSFGEIQDRTNRLTLCSQKCSQEAVEHNLQEEHSKPHPNFYYQQYGSAGKCVTYDSAVCTKLHEIPVSPRLKEMNPDFIIHSYVPVECNNEVSYVQKNDFQSLPLESHVRKTSENYHYHTINHDHHSYRNQNYQSNQEPVMNCIPVQYQQLQHQQPARQPIKFIAVEGNRMPSRRPIYKPEDTNSCSFTHKVSISNQHFSAPMNPLYSKDISNQQHYSSLPSNQYNVQRLPPNAQDTTNFNSGVGSSRNPGNFFPSALPNQTFTNHQSMPTCNPINNQRYGNQPMQIRMPSPQYAQVGYRHGYHSNSEDYNRNDAYLKQMMHHNYSQR